MLSFLSFVPRQNCCEATNFYKYKKEIVKSILAKKLISDCVISFFPFFLSILFLRKVGNQDYIFPPTFLYVFGRRSGILDRMSKRFNRKPVTIHLCTVVPAHTFQTCPFCATYALPTSLQAFRAVAKITQTLAQKWGYSDILILCCLMISKCSQYYCVR